MQKYNICYSLDFNYVEQFCASVASVLTNSDKDEFFNFFILDGGLSDKNKAEINILKNIKNFNIRYIKMKEEDFRDCPLLCNKSENYKDYHVTLPTYYRFLLPDLLNDLNKILYLDCDVIVRSSLKELINQNFDGNAAIMVLDAESEKNALRLNINKYFNAGVMLINLDYWRSNDIKNKLFSYAKNNSDKILWQDQDIINSVLAGNIKEVSKKWNYQYFQYENIDKKNASEAVIIHLAGRFKPWLIPFESEIYNLYYEYLNLTAFKNKIFEYLLNASGKKLKDNIGGSVTNIVLNVDDKDLDKCYKEINKSYNYTDEQINLINIKTDEKISKVYNNISDNVTKCYDYTNNQIGMVNIQTDGKVSKVYDEISKNYKFTSNLAEEKEINITKETDLKFSEIYSYTNSHVSNLYNELKNAGSNIEINLNNKITDIYNINAEIDGQITNLKQEISTLVKTDAIDLLRENFKKIIEEKNLQFSIEINNVKSEFENKLNEQRIKYEHKLIDMENQLCNMNLMLEKFVEEMKKTPFQKFKEKFYKKK